MSNVLYHCVLLGTKGVMVLRGKTTRELEITYPNNVGVFEIDEKQAKLIMNDGKEPLRYVADAIVLQQRGLRLCELQEKAARSKSRQIDYDSI